MLQRIQTVYLLLATALSAIACFVQTTTSQTIFSCSDLGESTCGLTSFFADKLVATLLLGVVPIILFVSIWLFKNRKLQARFISIAIVFLLMYYLLVIYICIVSKISLLSLLHNYHLYINIATLIFCFFAVAAIRKDENLIKSYDRLR